MAIVGLDHVQVAAPPGCEGAARWFYGSLLGLDELVKPAGLAGAGGCWFAVGDGLQLHVGVTTDFVAARKAHPAFRVAGSELVALAGALAEAGFEVRWDQEIAGVRRFFSADPWGNRLEFVGAGAGERRA